MCVLIYDTSLVSILKALQIAGETLQKSPEAVPKFVVAFVEGEQYGSNGMALLRDAAKPLQVLGVTVYAVGIGNRLNRQELVTITESSEHIVNVTRFSDLLGQVEFIARLIGKKHLFSLTKKLRASVTVLKEGQKKDTESP